MVMAAKCALWPIWCGRYDLWPIWIFRVAEMVFGYGRYRLAVADIVLADIVCGRYCHTPNKLSIKVIIISYHHHIISSLTCYGAAQPVLSSALQ